MTAAMTAAGTGPVAVSSAPGYGTLSAGRTRFRPLRRPAVSVSLLRPWGGRPAMPMALSGGTVVVP
jgi:hypothetical protein